MGQSTENPQPPEAILALLARLGHGPGLLAQLSRHDLGALRATCRDGRALLHGHLTQLELRYLDRRKLVPADTGEAPGAAAEAAQTSHWPALLARFPRCTSLTILVGPMPPGSSQRLARPDPGQRLLGPFAARPETTAHVTRLRLRLDNGLELPPPLSSLPLPASLPGRLASLFPALSDLLLDGEWVPPDTQAFYAALSQHLPGLRCLQLGSYGGVDHIRLLPPRLTQLRELTLGVRPTEGCCRIDGPQQDVSRGAAAALASFPQLRVLRLYQLSPADRCLPGILCDGLAPTLTCCEVAFLSRPFLRLTAAAAAAAPPPPPPPPPPPSNSSAGGSGSDNGSSSGSDCSGSGGGGRSGGSGGGGAPQARVWDVALDNLRCHNGGREVCAAAAAVVAAGLPVGRLEIRLGGVEISRSPLLRRCRQAVTEHLCLECDREAQALGEALRMLGPPKVLEMHGVRRAASLARLETLAADLMAPRLTRLEFFCCTGLTAGVLVATLAALPRCEALALSDYCSRIVGAAQYRQLVSELVALPDGAELRRRPLRVELVGLDCELVSDSDVSEGEEEGEGEGGEWEAAMLGGERLGAVEREVAWVVRRVMQRVRVTAVGGELNEALVRGGMAARVVVRFGQPFREIWL
ncbi:hypothetical protein PLESTB_000308300 [Pleodorina starrii]|uniref:Uncharacterized protein n=1 Tax=Pleodorina starrii TaxID=330485 RepID=A0A9W6EYQ8_9CHLO|nr:hypothetical protein PLESTM_001718800 [Pleodorina starrii]GLC49784.1 hypothetical protein PLESTB_000308300 [Pleodorina starrii]GLC76256.1 hypothetical protein PLESTF_001756100 [Pleodorina starrii]